MRSTRRKPERNMSTAAQKSLAIHLLEWHGGQGSGLYAVGSCMLSDVERGFDYDPKDNKGHAGESGAVARALRELRNLKQDAAFPASVTPRDEAECNRLADELEAFIANVR